MVESYNSVNRFIGFAFEMSITVSLILAMTQLLWKVFNTLATVCMVGCLYFNSTQSFVNACLCLTEMHLPLLNVSRDNDCKKQLHSF